MAYGRRTPLVIPGALAFSPTDIPGLLGWYDADAATTFSFGVGTLVSVWGDKNGGVNSLLQGNATKQPNRNGSQNGRTTVVFDGSRCVRQSAPTGDFAQPLTVASAFKADNADTAQRILINFGQAGFLVHGWYTEATWRIYADFVLDSNVFDDALWHTGISVINGASSLIILDGSQIGSGDSGASGGNKICVGAYDDENQSFWDGEIAEICVYHGALSVANRLLLQRYLKAKWATV
jgi:hypothetical protein